MELYNYQKEAIKQILNSMKSPCKLLVRISTGLGRSIIIADLSQKIIQNRSGVLILSPNRSMCFKIKNILSESYNTHPAMDIKESDHKNILIITYNDFKHIEADDLACFGTVICDGIHYLNEPSIEKVLNVSSHRIIGFTSQIDGPVSGWFADANCIFRYTFQDAVHDGNIIRGYEFEIIVQKIFEKQGYSTEFCNAAEKTGFDLKAYNKRTGTHYAIEVKTWENEYINKSILEKTVTKLSEAAKKEGKAPVLVIGIPFSKKNRQFLSILPGVTVIDINNLLYMVQGYPELKNSLIDTLHYSSDRLKPVSPEIPIDGHLANTEEEKNIYKLIETVKNWDAKKEKPAAYEKLCFDILKALFSDDLITPRVQCMSNDGLFRFDLIYKIKNQTKKEFWRISENYFRSKYILFEFKNYSDQITQTEIYTTVKYLYKTALRCVAIIISANGADKNAEKTCREFLRNEGKLIINLSNLDMLEMLRKKLDNEDPADYLSEKLDHILIDLEK